MANRLKMVVVETILRLHQSGWSNRRIARELGIHREAVAGHIRQAESKPASALAGSAADAGGIPPADTGVSPKGRHSDSEPFRTAILDKLELGLSAQRVYQDLVTEHGFAGSCYSVRRFVRRLGQSQPLPFRRMECAPGEEGQVDFGRGIPITGPDGKRRGTHVFRIVLSHSRKGYSEAVYRQTTEDFIRCLENAFQHFAGVPQTLVLDNLKAGVLQPDWFDPELNPKLRSFAQHYGVAVLPTKPRMPRHKGKIESGVGYVKGNALKGHVFTSLEEENRHLLAWESNVADLRIHGTTRRQVAKMFLEVERPALRPLPLERFPFFHEGRRWVNRDGHVEVARAYYSVPPEYLGRHVWVRWDGRVVRVFNHQFESIAVHVQHERGRFSTQSAHIAPQKISGIERGAAWLLTKTKRIGQKTAGWAEAVIQVRGIEGVRVVQGLLSLAKQHHAESIEKACAIAHSCGSYRLRTIRRLIQRQAPASEQLTFLDAHPLIRSLADYGQIARGAIIQEVNR